MRWHALLESAFVFLSVLPTDLYGDGFDDDENFHLHFIDAVGDFKYSARVDDFNGWMACDGRSLDKANFRRLFDVIGTSFGGDKDKFNLPDFRGRVPGAIGGGQGLTSRSIGSVVGDETHTLTSDEFPRHVHLGTTASSGGHTHATNATGGYEGLAVADGTKTAVETDASAGELNVWTTPRALNVAANGDHAHGFTTEATGGSQSHNNMQPTLFAGNVFIYGGGSTAVVVGGPVHGGVVPPTSNNRPDELIEL